MPKLEIRNANPMFRLTGTDRELVAAEIVRRRQNTPAPRPAASEKAIAWANTLWGQKQTDQLSARLHDVGNRLLSDEPVYAREVSELIEALKLLPYRPRPAANKIAALVAKVGEGFYKLGDDFVKVQEAKNGSGRLYAKFWDGYNWAYQPGLVCKLVPEDALTPEQAKEWGDLYGCCIYCSRDLTDERSIDAGYGPVCAEKRGLPWG